MRNTFAFRLIGSLGLVVATIASVTFLSTYDDGLRMLSTSPFVRRLPSIRYELRAEQSGELYRGHVLDGDGLVRQIRVQFRDGTFGVKYTTGTGVLVGIKEVLKDGSYIVYDIERGGKTSNHQQLFSKAGVLLRDRQVGEKSVKVTLFAADGKTPTAFEENGEGSTSKIFLFASGKPRAKFKMGEDGAIEFVALSEGGTPLYSETATAANHDDEEGGGSQDIEVAVFREDGTLSFKQIHRSQYGNPPRLIRVEEYAADGKQIVRKFELPEDPNGQVEVTTIKADGTETTEHSALADVPQKLVGEPTHPAKDVESKLSESFDFPLHLGNLLH